MEKVKLRTLLETYYKQGNVQIVKVKGVDIYCLRRFSGKFEDDLYPLSGNQLEEVIKGTLKVEDLKEESWLSITEYENMCSQKRLERWKILGEGEEQRKGAGDAV